MNKQDFLDKLRKGLSGLPNEDIEERLSFYSEMIDDRIEEGFSEEEAVSAAGSVDEIVAQAIADTPLTKIAKERIKPKRGLRTWEIVLLAIGSPIWLSLGIAAFAVTIAIYAVLWSVIITLWSVFAAIIGSAVGTVVAGVMTAVSGNLYPGVVMIGVGLFSVGLAIFAFFGCRAATNGFWWITKKVALWIKGLFIKKEAVQ